MTKIKKHQLIFENELDIEVFGISSASIDYRLAWELNSKLFIQFEKKSEKLIVEDKKTKTDNAFSYYYYFDEESLTKFYLIRNKQELKLLESDKYFADYFFCLKNNNKYSEEKLLTEIRTINAIVAVFALETDELEFIEHLNE